MINFVKKIILFLVPIGIIFIFPATVLFLGKEYYSVEDVVRTQTEEPAALFGFSYHDFGTLYKASLIAEADPEIIALGSSRVMQIRKEYFSEPGTFINAGGGAIGINGIEKFVKELPPDSKIDFIILGLDQEMFKITQKLYSSPIPNYGDNASERLMNLLVINWKKIYGDYFAGKFTLRKLFERSVHSSSMGVSAIINQDGFRSDGSYQYRKNESDINRVDHLASEINTVIQTLKQDRGSYYYGDRVSAEALATVDSILTTAAAKGINVIGFSPPYPQQIYQEMVGTDDVHKQMVTVVPQEIKSVFAAHGLDFYDFSDISLMDASDSEFVDPIHGTDKMYLRVIISMAEQNEHLRQQLELAELKNLLENTDDDFIN